MAAHAFSVLDSYIYGFALQERSLPFDTPEETAELAQDILSGFPTDRYPHLAELTTQQVSALATTTATSSSSDST